MTEEARVQTRDQDAGEDGDREGEATITVGMAGEAEAQQPPVSPRPYAVSFDQNAGTPRRQSAAMPAEPDRSSWSQDYGASMSMGTTQDGVAVTPAPVVTEEKSIAQIIRRISMLPCQTGELELDRAVEESREVILRIKGKVGYLPPTYADKLLFLAHAASNPTWVPFEEGQARVFAKSNRADHRTSFWLHPVVAVPLMLAFSCASYVALASFSDGFGDREAVAVMSFVGMLGSFFSNVFGWYVTGINPDQSSIAANARQNAVLELVALYDELAYELIDLWKVDKLSCKVLCGRIDVGWIKQAARRAGANDAEVSGIFRLFDASLAFIVHGVLPRQHHLIHYISSRHELLPSCSSSDGDPDGGVRQRSMSVGPRLHTVVDQWITSAASLRPLKIVSSMDETQQQQRASSLLEQRSWRGLHPAA